MKKMQIFIAAITMLPLFSMAQDAMLDRASHQDKNRRNFEVSASFGYADYSYPVGKFFYTLVKEGTPALGMPAQRGHSPKATITASAYIIKSVDVGLTYSANEMKYAIALYAGDRDGIGYAARPASRVSVFSKYHYAIKNIEFIGGPSIGTIHAPGGLERNSKGLTYSVNIGVRYRISGGLYGSVSADYTKDYLGKEMIQTKGAAMSEGWATMAGVVFKF